MRRTPGPGRRSLGADVAFTAEEQEDVRRGSMSFSDLADVAAQSAPNAGAAVRASTLRKPCRSWPGRSTWASPRELPLAPASHRHRGDTPAADRETSLPGRARSRRRDHIWSAKSTTAVGRAGGARRLENRGMEGDGFWASYFLRSAVKLGTPSAPSSR